MAYTTINKSTDYFTPHIWSGTNSNHTESIGMQPDLVWVKGRNNTTDHTLFDAVRGPFGNGNSLSSNTTAAEGGSNTTAYGGISGVTSDGFTVTAGSGNADYVNTSGRTYASWNWKANGTGSANTDGSISSTVSANTTSGFSIVKYTGNGTGNSTIGHGLGATPKFIIVKCISATQSWGTYSPSFVSASEPRVMYLNQTGSYANDTNVWGTSAAFNNNTFTVGDWAGSNASGQTFIAYCFADVRGFSKMGSYTGNGNADGSFIYTGFSPAFVMIKQTTGTGKWVIKDNKRTGINVNQSTIYASESEAEGTPGYELIDLLSTGFKQRGTGSYVNGSGQSYIYMAFAEAPLVGTNGVTAKAR